LLIISKYKFKGRVVSDNNMRLLVIDDSKISRKLLIEAIPEIFKKNMDIIEANSGLTALDIYKENKADIVFLDITMPEMDGFEVLEKLIQIDKEATVIMISADAQISTKVKVLHLGAKNILVKPVEADAIRNVLLELMK